MKPAILHDSLILAAQQRLAEACMRQQMTPQAFTISAFINVTLNSAATNALIEYVTLPVAFEEDGTLIEKDSWETVLLKHIENLIAVFDREAPRIQVSPHVNGRG